MADPNDAPQQDHATQKVGRGWMITGELAIEEDTVFEGQINGTLRATGNLELGEAARVSGTVIGKTVRVSGQVEADLIGQKEVELLPGSKVRGRVYSQRFVVAQGAGFRGEIWIDDQAMQAAEQQILREPAVDDDDPPITRKAARPDVSDEELAMLRNKAGSRPLRMHGPPGNGR